LQENKPLPHIFESNKVSAKDVGRLLETNKERIQRAVEDSFYRFIISAITEDREKQIENKRLSCYNNDDCEKRFHEKGGA